MTNHTPGPWRARLYNQSNGSWVIEGGPDSDYEPIASTLAYFTRHHEANARLIAESPALYDLLKRARSLILELANERDMCLHDFPLAYDIDEAIARIEGVDSDEIIEEGPE